MSGTFNKSNRPKRAGAYFAFQAIQNLPPPPGLAGIVCVPFTNDWGPSRVTTLLRSFADYVQIFGDSTNTMGYRAVRQAFQGEGLPSYGGAGAVLAFRMSGAAAAKGTRILQNATPAAAITLTARWEGTRGNAYNVTTQNVIGNVTFDNLLVYDGATLVESYIYLRTDINDLANQINARSNYLSATMTITGVGLAYVANVSITGGLGGETLISSDWTAMMSSIEIERFSVLAAEFPTDSPTLTALKAWAQNARNNGKKFRTVVGGALNESNATAIGRAQSFNDEGFIVIGQGSVTDPVLGVLSTTQLAPRVGGILAARGEAMSLTYARFAGLALTVGPTDAEISVSYDNGLIVLARDSNTLAPVRIEKGITSYTTQTNIAKPYLIFSRPKFIATMDGLQMELTDFAEQFVIGKLPVNASTRAFVRAQISQSMKRRELAGVVQPGWTVSDDLEPPSTPQDDFMQFVIGMTFGRSTEQVYYTASVG